MQIPEEDRRRHEGRNMLRGEVFYDETYNTRDLRFKGLRCVDIIVIFGGIYKPLTAGFRSFASMM